LPGTNALAYYKKIVNHGQESFITLAHRGLYYKILRIHNVRTVDRFLGKLVALSLLVTFTGVDKHTGLLCNPSICVHYEPVMFYRNWALAI